MVSYIICNICFTCRYTSVIEVAGHRARRLIWHNLFIYSSCNPLFLFNLLAVSSCSVSHTHFLLYDYWKRGSLAFTLSFFLKIYLGPSLMTPEGCRSGRFHYYSKAFFSLVVSRPFSLGPPSDMTICPGPAGSDAMTGSDI